MFKELRQLASSTTGRPENVARELVKRYQLRQLCHESGATFHSENDDLNKKASSLPTIKENSRFSTDFITKHRKAFDAHLQRIADYLLPGPEIWWQHDGNAIVFYDSISCPECRPEGPQIKHFRHCSVSNALLSVQVSWKRCLKQKVQLPVQHQSQPEKNVDKAPSTNAQLQQESSKEGGEHERSEKCLNTTAETSDEHVRESSDEHDDSDPESSDNPDQESSDECDNSDPESGDECDDSDRELSDKGEDAGLEAKSAGHAMSSEPPAKRARVEMVRTVLVQERKDSNESDIVSSERYTTKHAKWAAYVLGHTVAVKKFDQEKANMSSNKPSASLQLLSQQLQVDLAKELKVIHQKIAEGDMSTHTDNKRRLAERLLASW